MVAVNETGNRYGRLIVTERGPNDKFGKAQWWCHCDCGNDKLINGASLRKGLTKSCGCLLNETRTQYNESKTINEVGNRYGYLTVISRNNDPELQKDGRAMWNCLCDCGNDYVVSGRLLRIGKVTSCGCRTISVGEQKVEELLLDNNINFAKQYRVNIFNDINQKENSYYFDFVVFKDNEIYYFIEYDGSQHYKCSKSEHTWNNEDNFTKVKRRDLLKNNWCKNNSIPLIRNPYPQYGKLCINDLKLETTTFLIKGEIKLNKSLDIM